MARICFLVPMVRDFEGEGGVLFAWKERLNHVERMGWRAVRAQISDFLGLWLFFDGEWKALIGLCKVPRG